MPAPCDPAQVTPESDQMTAASMAGRPGAGGKRPGVAKLFPHSPRPRHNPEATGKGVSPASREMRGLRLGAAAPTLLSSRRTERRSAKTQILLWFKLCLCGLCGFV